ncbi:MAG TPA: thiolase family protein [Trebonia sp.]|nr:thiolase family protein [Trebonia sp.]
MSAVIIDAVRSPMGRGKVSGGLAGLHPVELLAQVLTGLVERTGLDPASVDDVLVGCVSQGGEQSSTPGRQAWLAAGYPTSTPSTTIERKCGSGQQAIEFAAAGIVAGNYDIAIAAGLESMSRVPMGSARMGQDPFGPRVHERFPHLVPQGVSAELVAQRWNLSRDALDEYSARSHELAGRAADGGQFKDEIVPVTVTDVGGTQVIDTDETIRRGTTPAGLAALRPAFAAEPYTSLFPQLDWKITAGNSSQITDGAAALLLTSEQRALELGLRPVARIVASSVVGDDPVLMLTGPIPASRRVLARAGMSVADIDVFEVNEAFASVPLAWQLELGAELARLNPCGGAIALGHPLGASGCRLMTTMISHLRRTGGRYGLQTMCEAGGMANATIIEML